MKKIFLLCFAGASLGLGCNKILTQKPQASLDVNTAFSTRQAIASGVLGIYNTFQSAAYYGTDYTLFCDLEADNLDWTGSFPTYQEVANRTINPDNTNTTGIWNQIYVGVDRANAIIAASNALVDSEFDKAGTIAEAEALRAVFYFDLERDFGGTPAGYSDPGGLGIPIKLTSTVTAQDATPIARSSAGQVFAQILADLNSAIPNLPTLANQDEGRISQEAAVAFKARVFLYLQNYDSAAILSEQVISELGGGGLTNNYADIFNKKNQQPESIWELQYSATDVNGLFFYYFGRDEVASSQSLSDAHESGDARLPVNVFPFDGTVGTQKYDLADGTNNFMLIRLSEMYLTHAESVIRGSAPDIATAQSDLNVVRNRAGLANTTAATVSDLEDAILQENRVEFAHECHRWFDLRRLGLVVSTFGLTDPTKVLWPIPQNEVLTSGNVIAQNPGY
jgi:starch-binding outer membrane protein, SusD/RagB family